jgi:hypothetical protein
MFSLIIYLGVSLASAECDIFKNQIISMNETDGYSGTYSYLFMYNILFPLQLFIEV